jgi:hypothetical protein
MLIIFTKGISIAGSQYIQTVVQLSLKLRNIDLNLSLFNTNGREVYKTFLKEVCDKRNNEQELQRQNVNIDINKLGLSDRLSNTVEVSFIF